MKTSLSIFVILLSLAINQSYGQQIAKDDQANETRSIRSFSFSKIQDDQIKADPWVSIGPYGGDVFDIAVSPLDPNTLFAAAGVPYVSHNGGETWEVLDALKNIANSQINTFEVSSGGVLYASGPYSYNKIFRSVDGGTTWVQKSFPVNAAALDIVVDPAEPNTVYAGLTSLIGVTVNNVFIKSTNQGDNWTIFNLVSVLPVGYSVESLSVDPDNSQTIFAIGSEGLSNARVVASFDGGLNWENRTGNLPSGKPLNHITIAEQKVYIAGGQLFGGQNCGCLQNREFWSVVAKHFSIFSK